MSIFVRLALCIFEDLWVEEKLADQGSRIYFSGWLPKWLSFISWCAASSKQITSVITKDGKKRSTKPQLCTEREHMLSRVKEKSQGSGKDKPFLSRAKKKFLVSRAEEKRSLSYPGIRKRYAFPIQNWEKDKPLSSRAKEKPLLSRTEERQAFLIPSQGKEKPL